MLHTLVVQVDSIQAATPHHLRRVPRNMAVLRNTHRNSKGNRPKMFEACPS